MYMYIYVYVYIYCGNLFSKASRAVMTNEPIVPFQAKWERMGRSTGFYLKAKARIWL